MLRNSTTQRDVTPATRLRLFVTLRTAVSSECWYSILRSVFQDSCPEIDQASTRTRRHRVSASQPVSAGTMAPENTCHARADLATRLRVI